MSAVADCAPKRQAERPRAFSEMSLFIVGYWLSVQGTRLLEHRHMAWTSRVRDVWVKRQKNRLLTGQWAEGGKHGGYRKSPVCCVTETTQSFRGVAGPSSDCHPPASGDLERLRGRRTTGRCEDSGDARRLPRPLRARLGAENIHRHGRGKLEPGEICLAETTGLAESHKRGQAITMNPCADGRVTLQ